MTAATLPAPLMLDWLLPEFDATVVEHRVVDGDPESVYRVVETLDMAELAFGVIGRFWEGETAGETIDAADFVAFERPGYAKIACSVSLVPRCHRCRCPARPAPTPRIRQRQGPRRTRRDATARRSSPTRPAV